MNKLGLLNTQVNNIKEKYIYKCYYSFDNQTIYFSNFQSQKENLPKYESSLYDHEEEE
jgi:hypothetical protein